MESTPPPPTSSDILLRRVSTDLKKPFTQFQVLSIIPNCQKSQLKINN